MSRDISNMDDIIDVRQVIERVEELREQRTPRFIVGYNLAGYMPDADPGEFGDWGDAQRELIDILKRFEDEEGIPEGDAAEYCHAAEDVNLWSEIDDGDDDLVIHAGLYAFWIRRDGFMGLDSDEENELELLEELLSDLAGYGGDHQWEGDWYPVTLIRDSYFQTYAQEFAEDIGAVEHDAQWPNNCIDWEQAARELRMDYSSVDFDGETYWYR
ncbi:hypothetical protein HOR55_gp43 [Ralstonia phage RS-PII-1]|uniref:Antirestriction protein n=1 Tax=Ralstonia phage RS-PII-1 TaxID=1932892 RepID=A0A1L7DQE4_9CAUD|nr:hypothetical protein HOR55_gp43 [Ralstonia phage RS-PII-1]APU00330.1 hypothetical protein [Ralstonia phage RS-PII-1]